MQLTIHRAVIDRDGELLEALRRRDATAAERLVSTFGDCAYRLVIGITSNQQDAEEAAEVDLGTTDGEYDIAARLRVSLPGIDRETAQALVDGAHQLCTYSRATRGNVDLTITLV